MKKIILVLFGISLLGAGCPASSPQVACTMEAKMCPDGSYVGRSGPKCEFDPCPIIQTTSSKIE